MLILDQLVAQCFSNYLTSEASEVSPEVVSEKNNLGEEGNIHGSS
jgi:hypothetical protein